MSSALGRRTEKDWKRRVVRYASSLVLLFPFVVRD